MRPNHNRSSLDWTNPAKIMLGIYQDQPRTWPNRYTSRAFRQSFDLHLRVRFAKLQIA